MNTSIMKLLRNSTVVLSLGIFSCYGHEQKEEQIGKELKEPTLDLNQVSEAFGHLIGKNLQTLGLEFDVVKVIKGIQDAIGGKDAPMTEADCIQAISLIQAKNNLQIAEDFLASNSKKEGVIELEPNKLQYKIEHTGNGEVVKPHCTPTIRYVGKYPDGNVFGASKEGEPISLDETLPGFTKAIIGMREGEKRTIYIHPELGYGTSGYLAPNSLLTFEIEIVKADTPLSEIKQDTNNDEIAESFLNPANVR
jgi:peptidylprolyl isomerase